MDVSSLVHLFYNNPTFSDITMFINEEPVHLHKIILAQSPKFATALESDNPHNTIVLENYDFVREMKTFLRAFYTGIIELESVNVQFMLMLSVEYDVPWIEHRCALKLGELVTSRNVLEYLEIACKVHSETLEELCVREVDVTQDNLVERYELACRLSSSALQEKCVKVLSRYRTLWRHYTGHIWTSRDLDNVLKVLMDERSMFAVPAQILAIISWIEHEPEQRKRYTQQLYSSVLLQYLPYKFTQRFVSPALFSLTHSYLPVFLANFTVTPFTYFVKTDSPEERATEKCKGSKTVFYAQGIAELEYREYSLSVPAKLFKFRNEDEACHCMEGVVECVCSSTISACHVLSAGFLLTINPKRKFPVYIDSGKCACYWYVDYHSTVPWTRLCGVTYGHSNLPLDMNDILNIIDEREELGFHFFM